MNTVTAFALTAFVSAAPVPKTTAELLIGTWKLVECDRPRGEPVPDFTIEYAKDNRVVVRIGGKAGMVRVLIGKYEVTGNTIRRTIESGTEDDWEKHGVISITHITEDMHKAKSQDPRGGQAEFRRVNK